MKFDFAHFEGSRVPMAHQVADESAVVGSSMSPSAVGYARGLDDGAVIAHIVDDTDESVVENWNRNIEKCF